MANEMTITISQVKAILAMDDILDVTSHSPGDGEEELRIEQTKSKSGGRHLYVDDKQDESRCYHISRKGAVMNCERVSGE